MQTDDAYPIAAFREDGDMQALAYEAGCDEAGASLGCRPAHTLPLEMYAQSGLAVKLSAGHTLLAVRVLTGGRR